MSTPEGQATAQERPGTAPGVVATGWLAADSTFGHEGKARLGAGFGASMALHGALFGIILLVFALAPKDALDQLPDKFVNLVFLQVPGPGGGGGGAAPEAPPKPLEIPKPKAPEPDPILPVPVPTPVVPPPQLLAPIITPDAQILQASGAATISLARQGGGGRGEGVGRGRGRGLGEGQGGGTGGGVYQLGAGIVDPKVVKEVRPAYTPEAMRAKIQGSVRLQVVILKSGMVGDVKILKSLDPNGLDQEAIKAARGWLFQPATLRSSGEPIDVYAELELAFRIF
jgi:TonB family protein